MKNIQKKLSGILALLLICSSSVPILAKSTELEQQKSVVLYVEDISNYTKYQDQISDLIKDENISSFDVILPNNGYETKLTETKDDTISTYGTYHQTRVVNRKYAGQQIGSNIVAKASGVPGVNVQISTTVKVSSSYSSTINISASSVSAGVGFNVNKEKAITIGGSDKVPSTHNGRKVKSMTLVAKPMYDKYTYDIEKRLVKNGLYYPWSKKGSGYALDPIGYHFDKMYTYG